MEGKRRGGASPYFPTAFTTSISTPTPTNIVTAIPPPSVAPNFHRAALQKLSPPGFNPGAPAATHRRNFTAASLDPDQEIQTGMCRRARHPSALQRGLRKTATRHETFTSPSPSRKPARFLSSKAFPKQWANYQGNVSSGLEKKGASLPNTSRPGAADMGKMPTKTRHEPRRRGTHEPGRGRSLARSRSCRAPGPQLEPVHLSGRLEDRQQIPRRHLPAGGAVPGQTLEVGPRKLVTSLREEQEGMKGRRQLFLWQANKQTVLLQEAKKEREREKEKNNNNNRENVSGRAVRSILVRLEVRRARSQAR